MSQDLQNQKAVLNKLDTNIYFFKNVLSHETVTLDKSSKQTHMGTRRVDHYSILHFPQKVKNELCTSHFVCSSQIVATGSYQTIIKICFHIFFSPGAGKGMGAGTAAVGDVLKTCQQDIQITLKI